jgi:poly(3-hydroxybutyrate) depolymerase
VIVAAAVLAVAGCGAAKHRRAAADPSAAPTCAPAGRSDVEGSHLRMPAGARPGRTPLIVVVVPDGHGDRADRLGVRRGHARRVPRYTARWARRDGCAAPPRTTAPRPRVTRVRYRDCDDGLRVELLRLAGADHGWPGAGPPLPKHNPSASAPRASSCASWPVHGARDAPKPPPPARAGR